MTFQQRRNVAFLFAALVAITGVFFFVKWKSTPLKLDSQGEVVNQIPVMAAYHESVNTVDGQTIRNTECQFTFKIPADWKVYGILGESKILSPEDERVNEEWLKSPEGQAPAEEGSAGPALGPDVRSLYISCQYDLKIDDVKSRALKSIKINGRDAYEVADTGKMPDGTVFTNYKLILENGKVLEIHLGQTEYDNLSETAKQIIASIKQEGGPQSSTLPLGPIRYNCELSGGSFENDRCTCLIEEELGQTQELMYDKETGFCQSTHGGPAGDAFNASIGLPHGGYGYWTQIVMDLCTNSGGNIFGAACICPADKTYSKTNGKCE